MPNAWMPPPSLDDDDRALLGHCLALGLMTAEGDPATILVLRDLAAKVRVTEEFEESLREAARRWAEMN